MLQLIRGTVGSWIVKILFILLIASFGVWGIGDVIRSAGQSNTVAEVGGVEIGRQELDQTFRQQIQRLRPMFGGQFDVEQAVQMGMLDQSLQQIVQRVLIDLAARDAELRISDAVIRQRIADEPAFRNQQGAFDPDRFHRVLASNNLSEAGLIQMLRGEIARETVLGAIEAGAQAPQPLVETLYRFRNETRVAEVLTIRNAGVADVGQPDEAALQAFHQDKAVRFTAPEFRTLTVASLAPDDIAQDITVPDEEVRAAYDARINEFRTPERRSVAQALVETEEKAKEIAAAAGNAAGLADAAQKVGTDAMPLGQVMKEDLPEELADAVFLAPSGAITQPIRSALGWHVVGVTAIEPGSTQSFDEVKNQILADLRREKAADRLFEVSNQLEDALAGGANLEEAAARLGLRPIKIAAVDNTGKDPSGKVAEGVPALPEVLKTAFSLEKGQESRLAETKEGTYFLVRVDEVTPPALKPLNEVRPQVIAAWTEEQRAKKAAEKAEKAAQRLKDGAALDAVAQEFGGEAKVSEPFTRTAKGANLPPQLVAELFTLKPGAVTSAATGDSQVIARLKNIRPADPATAGAALAQVRDQAVKGIAGDLAVQFAEALRQKYPVEIQPRTLQSMYRRDDAQ
ncbi:MAG TPA: SurA N-terminal domain-containing protein [Azospirillaceae bacterium]|nr:SurA N-terminal domain-containing protein [Azospirillaceae bacterium]